MLKSIPAAEPDREQFPFRVPLITPSHSVLAWCRENLGEENQLWCCGKSQSSWASCEFLFHRRSDWELFLKHWG